MARCCPEDSPCYECTDAEAIALEAQFEQQAVAFQQAVADYQQQLVLVQQQQPDLPLYQQQLIAELPPLQFADYQQDPSLVVSSNPASWFVPPIPFEPPIFVADQPGGWFGPELAPVSPSQPPVIALDQPATAAASAGATPASTDWMGWFSRSTAVAGYAVPNWGLVAGGIGAVMLLGGSRAKGKRR